MPPTAPRIVLQGKQSPRSSTAIRREIASDAIRGAWHKFSIGLADDRDVLVGVAVIGRPVARLDDGLTLEVTRVATDGTRNSCSKLYAAAWTAAKALGYRRLVTYTANDEPGSSLRAAGWTVVAERRPAPGWSRPSRPRTDHGADHTGRRRWQAPPADPA